MSSIFSKRDFFKTVAKAQEIYFNFFFYPPLGNLIDLGAVYPVGPVLALKPPASGDGGEQEQQVHECVRWLDAQPPASVVLLCFGSIGGSFASPQVREIAADALEQSGHRFLWVLRGPPPAGSKTAYPTDANLDELLPEGFLERTKDRGLVWPKWAPQKDISSIANPAVGGFVTHSDPKPAPLAYTETERL